MSGVAHAVSTATIANGASLSGAVWIGGDKIPVAIEMPAAWTAAALTFQVSNDNSTYGNLYDDAGNEITVQADASQTLALGFYDFQGALYLKIRSGTAAAAVNQAAERSLKVIRRRWK